MFKIKHVSNKMLHTRLLNFRHLSYLRWHKLLSSKVGCLTCHFVIALNVQKSQEWIFLINAFKLTFTQDSSFHSYTHEHRVAIKCEMNENVSILAQINKFSFVLEFQMTRTREVSIHIIIMFNNKNCFEIKKKSKERKQIMLCYNIIREIVSIWR